MAVSVHPLSKVAQGKDQVAAELDGEMVILSFESGAYYSLDTVGACIWNLIQEPRTVAAVRDALVKEYAVEPDQCERELIDLLEDLLNEGLIEVRNEASLSTGHAAPGTTAVGDPGRITGCRD